jgi:hypothetical protein
MTNIRNELVYYDKELKKSELRKAVNILAIGNIISLDDEEEQNNNNFELSFNEDLLGSTLVLEDFVNLQDPIF